MIEITKDQCTRMLVSSNEMDWVKRLVIKTFADGWCLCVKAGFEDNLDEGRYFEAVNYRYYKPLPEPKQMSALDVLWWNDIQYVRGRIILTKESHVDGIADTFPCTDGDHFRDDMFANYVWNELIRKDGKTTLLYDEWKEFTFENCDMEEG